VPTNSISVRDREALRDLLDDPSSAVRRELLKAFESMGSLGISVLSEFAENSNRMLSWHARWYLAELKNANPIEEFKDFIESQNYELESGWLLISRVAYPDLDIGKILSELDLIAARCKELLIHPSSSREVCRIINRVLFHEFGFRGNIENYANPDNSHLNRVIETRRGLPIALSMLYLLVGQRLGANLEPIGVPGHFMVGSFDEDLPFYIDAFERGRILSAEQMLERLEDQNMQPELSILAPASIRETLSRACRNLARHYDNAGQLHMANLYKNFVEDFEETYRRSVQP